MDNERTYEGFVTIGDGMLENADPDEVIAEIIKQQLHEYADKSWKQYLDAQKSQESNQVL